MNKIVCPLPLISRGCLDGCEMQFLRASYNISLLIHLANTCQHNIQIQYSSTNKTTSTCHSHPLTKVYWSNISPKKIHDWLTHDEVQPTMTLQTSTHIFHHFSSLWRPHLSSIEPHRTGHGWASRHIQPKGEVALQPGAAKSGYRSRFDTRYLWEKTTKNGRNWTLLWFCYLKPWNKQQQTFA